MKLSALLILMLFATNLTGCDKVTNLTTSDVAMVKGGTLEFDKSLTVGQAIDKYRYFKKTEWEALKEDNGRRIVQTTGYFDIDKHPSINKKKNPELKTAFIRFQFIINQDKTFQMGWCGFGGEKNDGSKIEPDKSSNSIQCLNSLKEVYANEVGDIADTEVPEKNYCSDVGTSIRNAKTEMEAFFADNQKYPRQIPGKFADGVTVELLSVDDQKYSLKASHPKCNKIMLVNSDQTQITEQPR